MCKIYAQTIKWLNKQISRVAGNHTKDVEPTEPANDNISVLVEPTTSSAIITAEQAARFAPIVNFHQFEQFFPCSIDWLLQHSTLKDSSNASFSIKNPTQADLLNRFQDNYHLDIDPEAYAGQPLDNGTVVAPMYVSAQEWDNCIEISYIMLYAFQGGQTSRGLPSGNHFNCIVNDYGKHQGDLEWVSVLVSKDFSRVIGVGFEAHGDVSYYPPGQYPSEGEHLLVRVALNGHGCRNGQGKNDNDWLYTYELADIMGTVDIITKSGVAWRPHEQQNGLIIIGLDDQDNPLNDQVWAKFKGRLGKHLDNSLTGATDVDGRTGLNDFQWGWVKSVDWIGQILTKIPRDAYSGDAPEGPGARDFVRGLRRQGVKKVWLSFDNGYTSFNASAPPSIVAYNNLFHVFFRDGSGNGILHVTSSDGINWSGENNFYTGFNASNGPCPITVGNQLHIFFRDGSGNGILHIASPDGFNFQPVPNWYIGLNCDGQPAAAILNGTLCLVAIDAGGNGIMRAVTDFSSGWNVGYTRFNTSAPPSIVVYDNLFHVFFRDASGNGLMHIISPNGIDWSEADPFHPDFTTSAGVCPISFGNQLHIFFRDGTGNGILHIASPDGFNFQGVPGSWYIGLNCDGQPAATILNDTLCLVATDAGGNGIMRSVSKD
jgi:catechol 2,3-dioxygenase-like lactoylglutathione lyase family enzyme